MSRTAETKERQEMPDIITGADGKPFETQDEAKQ